MKDNLIVSYIADEEEYKKNLDNFEGFIKLMPEGKNAKVKRNIQLNKVKIAYKTASQVNYVARCGNFKKSGFEYNPVLRFLKTILSYDYLWNNVRVKGGAYGCMSNFMPKGVGFLVSYRDPNCRKTNEVYEGLVDYVKNFSADEREMTKYVIGTFSEIDVPMSASAKGVRSFTAYMKNQTEEELKSNRIRILEADSRSINELAGIVDAILEDDYLCVIGNSEKILSDKDMFDEITVLS